MIYIGFDFSIKKPACTILDEYGKLYHYCWPVDISAKSVDMLKVCDINVFPYKNVKHDNTYSDIMRVSLINAMNLSDLIIKSIKPFLEMCDVFIAQEGFSYNSKGSAILDLAGYKYILMKSLAEYVPLSNMHTYAPITVKKTANCAKKGMGKEDMINEFKKQDINTKFKHILSFDTKKLIKKTNYVECVDDIVDSYWVMKTMYNDLKT